MDAKIIQALKDNRLPIRYMPKELQKAMFSINQCEFLCLQTTSTINDPQWIYVIGSEDWNCERKHRSQVWKLRHDYEAKPEIVEMKPQKFWPKFIGSYYISYNSKNGSATLKDGEIGNSIRLTPDALDGLAEQLDILVHDERYKNMKARLFRKA